jgi:4-cresol dehydrogenase (hydroxylating)
VGDVLHGPEEVTEAQWQASQRHFAKIPGAQFKVVDRLKMPMDVSKVENYHEPEFGIPSLRAFSIGARTPFNPNPSKGHMWFSPIIPRTGEAIFEANRVFSTAAKELGMPLFQTFSMPACFWERSFIFILATPVTPTRPPAASILPGSEADRDRWPARLGRIPDRAGVPGIGHGCLFIQQPRPAPLP